MYYGIVFLFCVETASRKPCVFLQLVPLLMHRKNSGEKIKIELAWSLCNQGKYLGDLLL